MYYKFTNYDFKTDNKSLLIIIIYLYFSYQLHFEVPLELKAILRMELKHQQYFRRNVARVPNIVLANNLNSEY